MKRSRLWNQEFTVKVPVISDGKVVRTVGCALQRPQKIPRLSITIHFHSKFRLSETYARTTPARAIEEKKGENIASSNKEHASTKSEEKGKDKNKGRNTEPAAMVKPQNVPGEGTPKRLGQVVRADMPIPCRAS